MMLWHPRRWRSSIIPARSSTVRARPSPPWLISQLMQKTHRREQWEKKIVPDPPFPTSRRSSPKWGWCEAISSCAEAPQKPRAPASRFAPHSLGQSVQRSIIRQSVSPRCRSSPRRWSFRYTGSKPAAAPGATPGGGEARPHPPNAPAPPNPERARRAHDRMNSRLVCRIRISRAPLVSSIPEPRRRKKPLPRLHPPLRSHPPWVVA